MENRLLSKKEAAYRLGISEKTLDRMRADKTIKAVTIGARVLISSAEIDAFMSKNGMLWCKYGKI